MDSVGIAVNPNSPVDLVKLALIETSHPKNQVSGIQ